MRHHAAFLLHQSPYGDGSRRFVGLNAGRQQVVVQHVSINVEKVFCDFDDVFELIDPFLARVVCAYVV